MLFQGKTKAALRLLSEQNEGGALHLDDPIETENGQRKVRDILLEKHPPCQPVHHDTIINDDPPDVHPVLFESLDVAVIRSAALHTSGAAGPSGLDALGWRRLCTSFKTASFEFCHSFALTAKRLCTELVDPATIAPFMASRIIALGKSPGVRPIGIGDTARRIIAKAILNFIRRDIQDAAGSIQLCAGQISGIEAAVHAVRTLFYREEAEALLLVDASNASNSLNRQTALHNIQRLSPSLATALINTYRAPLELYVDGDVLLSREGTTQGDPLAMPMYALATIPLIRNLRDSVSDVKVTSEGRPYLEAALDTEEYIHEFVTNKVQQWARELEQLATIVRSQPHAAHAAFTNGMISKWTYLTRTMPGIGPNLLPLETIIRTKLIPALAGRPPPNQTERDLFALPARLGGIAMMNPTQATDTEFLYSSKITEALTEAILHQVFSILRKSLLTNFRPKVKFTN